MFRTTAISLMLTTTLVAVHADPGLLFHASFDDTLEALGSGGAVSPAKILGPDQPQFADGRIGRALVCGPGQSLIHYPTEGNVLPESGTVSLWVCPQDWQGADRNFHSFFESGSQESGTGWLVFYKYYQNSWLLLRYAMDTGQVGMATASASDWEAGQWRHIAGTWSREAMRIYIDGELQAEAPHPHVSSNLAKTFKVGDDGWHLPHEGATTLLDEMRVYSYPLSDERIRRLAGHYRLTVSRDPGGERWRAQVEVTEATAAVTIEVQTGDDEQIASAAATVDGNRARATLPVADVPPGEYQVIARLSSEDGQVIGASSAIMRRLERSRLALENEQVRVVFDGGTGAIISIEAPGLDWTATAPGAAAPLLTLDTVSFPKHARFFRPSDVTALQTDESSAQAIAIERVEGGQRLTASYEWEPGIVATITADLPDDASAVSLRAEVTCPRPLWPTDAVRVPTVRFPQVSGLRIGEDSSDDLLATGRIQGELLADPAQALPSERGLTYPGRACVPWTDLHDSGGGVALIPHADGSCQLQVIYGQTDGLVDFADKWWSLLEPGETWESPAIELSVHAGVWHDTADRFREWALAAHPPRTQPDWLATCDGWSGLGHAGYKFEDLPAMLANAQEYGLSYLQLWAQMIGGGSYYCFFYPNPDMGTPEDLRRNLQAVEDAGGHVGFYSNVITFDGGIDQNPSIQAIIDKYELTDMPPLPKFYEEVAGALFVGPTGELRSAPASRHSRGPYVDGYWPMDPNAKWWQDYLADWIETWGSDYGADVWYLDSFPIPGYGLGPASYALHLDHPRGLSEGQIALLKRIREGFDGPMLYEGVACAALMPWTNWCLGTEFSFGSGTWSRPGIFVYSFGDVYPVFSGSCNTWKGVGNIFPDIAEPRQEDAMNMVFLLGERFDVLNMWTFPADSAYGAHVKQLIALRARVRDVVYAGRMMDVRGLSGMPEGVEARVFVRQDEPGAVVTVWDRRAERAPWELRVDTSSLPWPEGLTGARLLALDGSETPAELAQGGGVITMPVDAAEVCAIKFK